MFTFHKPKVFRSVNGCCICKAKSSSSRFTDSKRYEPAFEKCFYLEEERSGEICNACVLLVKRYMKLPAGTSRHWNHVVDARSGPGIKNASRSKGGKVTKPKPLELENQEDTPDKIKRKHIYRHKSSSSIRRNLGTGVLTFSRQQRKKQPAENIRRIAKGSKRMGSGEGFLDMNIWKEQQICCGVIFRGPNGEVAIDKRYVTPCGGCKFFKEPVLVPSFARGGKSRWSNDARTNAVMADNEVGDAVVPSSSSSSSSMARAMKLSEDVHIDLVDDEGFFDKQAESPSSGSCSTPPLLPRLVENYPEHDGGTGGLDT